MKFMKVLILAIIFCIGNSFAQDPQDNEEKEEKPEVKDTTNVENIKFKLQNIEKVVDERVKNFTDSIQRYQVLINNITKWEDINKTRNDLKQQIADLVVDEGNETLIENLKIKRKNLKTNLTEVDNQIKAGIKKLVTDNLLDQQPDEDTQKNKTQLRSFLDNNKKSTEIKTNMENKLMEKKLVEMNLKILNDYLNPNASNPMEMQRNEQKKDLTLSWFPDYEKFMSAETEVSSDPDDTDKLKTLIETVRRIWQHEQKFHEMEEEFLNQDKEAITEERGEWEKKHKEIETNLESINGSYHKNKEICDSLIKKNQEDNTEKDEKLEQKTKQLEDVTSSLEDTEEELKDVDGQLKKAKEEGSPADKAKIKELEDHRNDLMDKQNGLKEDKKRLQNEIEELKSGSKRLTINGLMFGIIFLANVISFT